ncbi:MAG: hypothetical protein WBO73_05755, partial [Gammaproteobacteria bacterium]
AEACMNLAAPFYPNADTHFNRKRTVCHAHIIYKHSRPSANHANKSVTNYGNIEPWMTQLAPTASR